MVQYNACKAVQLVDIEAEVTQAKQQAKAKQLVRRAVARAVHAARPDGGEPTGGLPGGSG